MTDFRSLGHSIVPEWISGGEDDRSDAARVWHTYLTTLDQQGERARLGLLARFPDFAPDDAIPMLCQDRGIKRGFAEPRPSINARLKAWWDVWKRAGSPFALMDQIAAYLTGYAVRLRTVDNTGNWYTREPDGTTSYLWKQTNWDWDSATNDDGPTSWWRFWLIIYPLDTGLWDDEGVWGEDEDEWGDGGTWGTTATPDQVASIRELCRRWKPAGVHELWTIVAFDDASFDPTAPEPDGTWGLWGTYESSICVESRLETARYFDGTDNHTIDIGSD